MAAPARRLQLTLALLKPDAVAHPLVCEAVHAAILRHRFLIVRAKEMRCGAEQSRRFYREHAGRFFYQRLVEFMASGPMWAYILAHENAVPLWRSLMGPTKVFRARHSDPDSIRGAYGLTDTRNTTHGSDSPASASREIAFFFPEFDEQRWYEQDEPRLRHGQLLYSAQERVHRVLGAQPAQVQIQGSAGHHYCSCPQQCPEGICSGSCVSSHRSESCCTQCC